MFMDIEETTLAHRGCNANANPELGLFRNSTGQRSTIERTLQGWIYSGLCGDEGRMCG